MKVDNEAPNVFSMSALDLFASALGAFMLISVISLPFFSNTGNSGEQSEPYLEQAEDARARAAAAEAEAEALEAEAERLQAAADAVTLPSIDLLLVIDRTQSMREEIASLRSELVGLQRVLERLAPELAVGVVTFSDERRPVPIRQQPLQLITDRPRNLRRLQGFLDGIALESGNPDWAEAIDLALERAFSDRFRSESEQRIVLLITDSYPRPDRRASTLAAIRAFSSDPRNIVSTVSVGSPADNAVEAGAWDSSVDFLREAARAGGGDYVHSSYSVTASIIEAVL